MVSDVATSTVIDYDRIYLCGRGVLRFDGAKVYVGQALTPEQLASIARPEGFLATGRIYPAPAGWTPPASEEPEPGLHQGNPQAAGWPQSGGEPGLIAPPAPTTPQFVAPAAPESPVADPAADPALTPTEQESAAQTFVEAHDDGLEGDGDLGDAEVDDPFTT
jgi:hypothetical protein